MMKLALAGTAAALVGLTAVASAHDVDDKDGKRIRTVIVHKDGHDATRYNHLHVMAHGGKCRDATVRSDVDVKSAGEDGKTQRTRVLICNGEADAAKARAQVLEALEKARSDLAKRDADDLGAEHRAKALAALDNEIARLRGR